MTEPQPTAQRCEDSPTATAAPVPSLLTDTAKLHPEENALQALIKRRLRMFIVMFVMTLLLCEGLARYTVALEPPTMGLPLSLHRKAELAMRPPDTNRPGLLFLGNSLMYMGLIPELVAARLTDAGMPMEVRNLASPSNSANMDLALLKAAVKSGFRPRTVFFGTGISFMQAGESTNPLEAPFQKSWLYRCQLTQPEDFPAKAQCLAEKTSYFYRYLGHFKQVLTGDLGSMLLKPDRFSQKEAWQRENYVHEEISQSGWAPSYRIYSQQEYLKDIVESPKGQKAVRKMQASLNQLPKYKTQPEFQALVSYCESQGIPLVLVGMPGYSFPTLHLDRHPNFRKANEADWQAATAYLKQHPGVRFLDMSRDDDTIHYEDRGHQNAVGAVALSERIAKALKTQPYRAMLSGKTSED